MANPDFPQNREEMLLNAIAGSPYDVPAPAPQSRVEKWLAFLAENGIPGNVKIGEDVDTVADLPAEGAVGEMHYVTAESLFYVRKETDGTGEWIPVGADFDPSEFARADGTYPEMKVGYSDVAEYSAYAEQLDSNQKLTVSSPFVFRPAGGGADVEEYLGSKAKIAAIYGNTLIWNQNWNVVDRSRGNLSVVVDSETGEITATLTEAGNDLSYVTFEGSAIAGHKYLLARVTGASDGSMTVRKSGTWRTGSADYTVLSNGVQIVEANYDGSLNLMIDGRDSAITYTELPIVKKYKIYKVDLTRMFGAGHEPTAEEFAAMFPLPYYAYDAGRLLNFTGTGIKTVGFNALAPDGTAKLLGGKAYEIVGTYTALSYSTGETITPVSGIFTPSAEGILTVTGADAETCVHLVWSGYRNGEYAPYHAETKAIPVSTYFPDGMRGIGTVRDELRADRAVKRCGLRAHLEGDEDDSSVVTDGTNTVYALADAVETPINPPLDMTFNSSDFGTELILPENGAEPTTTPVYAAIDYVQNLRDKLQRLPNGVAEGDYYVHSDGVKQEYKPLPTVPADDGVYTLKCTVASGTQTFAWVAETETQTEPDAGGETV